MTEPTDLFANGGGDQLNLFVTDEIREPPVPQSHAPNPEDVRRRLNALLDTARVSNVMPWPEAKARMWRTVFPQMADWLPGEEAEQLCFAFAREMERLKTAA
jgi:hypothetical protein